MTKTREEVEKLMGQWYDDPCWDIEDTEGFEDYRQELLEYRRSMEHTWAEARREVIEAFAELYHLRNNPKLAEYLYTKLGW